MSHKLLRVRNRAAALLAAAIALACLPGALHAQWTYVQPVDSSFALYGIDFPTDNVGYAVGWGVQGSVMMKTTDGGATWARQNVGGALLFTAKFSDADNGMVAGYLDACQCGLLLKTTDGGATWATGTSTATFGFYVLAFPDKDTGYVCGYNGAILKTVDGGSNWKSLNTGTTDVFRRIFFPSAQVGYGLAGPGNDFARPSQLYKTTDGGATWNRIQNYNGTRVFADIYFTSENVGFLVGHDGKEAVYKTLDGGVTWTNVFHGTDSDIPQTLTFADANTGYAGSTQGRILRTVDGGATWDVEETGTDLAFLAVAFHGKSGFVGANAGAIMKRTGTQSVAGSGRAASGAAISIAPNPLETSAIVTIENVEPGTHYTLTLYDALGRVARVIEGMQGKEGFTLQRDGLASGAYVYRLQAGTGNGSTGSLIVR